MSIMKLCRLLDHVDGSQGNQCICYSDLNGQESVVPIIKRSSINAMQIIVLNGNYKHIFGS